MPVWGLRSTGGVPGGSRSRSPLRRELSFLGLLLVAGPVARPAPQSGFEELLESSWRLRRDAGQPWVLTGGSVLDVRTGEVLEGAHVAIQGDRILSVSAEEPPESWERRDVSGQFILPGLCDLHAHIQAISPVVTAPETQEVLEVLLQHGVTLVRELPLTTEFAVQLSALVQSGVVRGPTIVPASSVFERVPQRTSMGFGKAEVAAEWVRREALAGARWIKIYNSMDEESLEAIVQAARPRGLEVCGHTEEVPPLRAAEIGVKSLEHHVSLPLSCLKEGIVERDRGGLDLVGRMVRRWQNVDDERCAELLQRLRELETAWVPTLVVVESILRQGGHVVAGELTEEQEDGLWYSIERAAEWAVEQHRAGGLVGIGTDFPINDTESGRSVHRELELLVELGTAEPYEAIQMATLGSARILGLDSLLGTVEAGKLAHLVLLDRNPFEDLGALATIRLVIHDGREVWSR